MAKILGASGAWQTILSMLSEVGLQVQHPREIQALLDEHKKQLETEQKKAQQKIKRTIRPIHREIEAEKDNIRSGIVGRTAELESEIHQIELSLELYRLDKNLLHRFRIARTERRLQRRQQDLKEANERLNRLLAEQDGQLAEKRGALETEILAQTRATAVKVETLEKALGAKELTEAVTELEMLAVLSQLPDGVCVVNNVRLEAERGTRFQGKSFWEAQIDHLVITPAGLFTINLRHAAKPAGADTSASFYEQVARASHLCYELLKQDFPGVTVRGIVAHRGHAPEQSNNYVKTLPFSEVNGYITWFKDNTLNATHIQQIADYLQERSG